MFIKKYTTGTSLYNNGFLLYWLIPSLSAITNLYETGMMINGKVYLEFRIYNMTNPIDIGIINPTTPANYMVYSSDGKIYNSGTAGDVLTAYTSGDCIGLYYDKATNYISFYKNSKWQKTYAIPANYSKICVQQRVTAATSNLSGYIMINNKNFLHIPQLPNYNDVEKVNNFMLTKLYSKNLLVKR